MNEHRHAALADDFAEFESPFAVESEFLKIGMQFHAFQPKFQQMVEISLNISAFGVQSAESGEQAGVSFHFAAYKFVYCSHLFGRSCHRMNQIVHYTNFLSIGDEAVCGTIERHSQFVEILYTTDGSGGNVCRIYVAMSVYCFLHFAVL